MDNSLIKIPNFNEHRLIKKRNRYCCLIPVINEGPRIRIQLGKMQKLGISLVCDVIMCDGGSTDGSMGLDFLSSMGVNTVLIKRGLGKLSAQMRMGLWWGLQEGYEGCITVDGNGKDGIEAIPSFCEKLDEGFDFVQGSRFIAGGKAENTPVTRLLALRLIHAPLISLAAGFHFTDTTNAFRAYSRKYINHPEVLPFRDVFETYELLAYLSVRASQLGLKVCEIPVERIYPKSGPIPTKISFLKGNWDLIKILFATISGSYNPK